jgi:hypothetical protein
MFREVPPIHLYLYPVAMFIIGGAIYAWTGWGWVMGLIYFAGIVSILHLGIADTIEQVRKLLSERNEGYDQIRKMDEPTKYQLGLAPVTSEVKVIVDKTASEGTEFSQSWRKLPIPPWKMKIVAQSCLNGTGFTIRQWAGDGKLLSDPEWRVLKDALLNLNFIALKNPKDAHQGFEWTDLGRQMLEQCVAAPLPLKSETV